MNIVYMALAAAIFTLISPAELVAGGHDRALRAYETGEVVSLGQVLTRVGRAYPGQVLEIELDEGGRSSHRVRWVYAVKLLTLRGNVLMLWLDAKTMKILDVRGRGADARKKRR